MTYEDIVISRKFVEIFKNEKLFPALQEELKSLIAVLDYADSEYINHCEEVGRIAVEDIERMKEEWTTKAIEWFRKYFDGMHSDTFEIMIECFREYMENKNESES